MSENARAYFKVQKATDNVAKQLFGRKLDDLSVPKQIFVTHALAAKIDRGERAEYKEHSEFGKDTARQIAIDHLAENANNYPLTHGMIHKAKKGWYGDSFGHRNAAYGIPTRKNSFLRVATLKPKQVSALKKAYFEKMLRGTK